MIRPYFYQKNSNGSMKKHRFAQNLSSKLECNFTSLGPQNSPNSELAHFSERITELKGTVQRKLRWVKSGINR
jgi:hypothetical protein